jgi:hypothetical protein
MASLRRRQANERELDPSVDAERRDFGRVEIAESTDK